MKFVAQSPYTCARCVRALREKSHQHVRNFSAPAARRAFEGTANGESTDVVPRWKRTPPRMRMPIRLRPEPRGPAWTVNKDQEPVDDAYDRFIGQMGGETRGRDMLDEETKWLALTHKSYAHGAQGFNDRLAFLGRRILDLQTSLALLRTPASETLQHDPKEVFQHPSLDGLENLTAVARHEALNPSSLAGLAYSYGIARVVRWKPKKADNLQGSGVETVLAQTMYSLIGALALKKGGEVAARVARERILQPLGLK